MAQRMGSHMILGNWMYFLGGNWWYIGFVICKVLYIKKSVESQEDDGLIWVYDMAASQDDKKVLAVNI